MKSFLAPETLMNLVDNMTWKNGSLILVISNLKNISMCNKTEDFATRESDFSAKSID